MSIADTFDLELMALSLSLVGINLIISRRITKRRWWERLHLEPINRRIYSQMSILDEMKMNHDDFFTKYLRFTPDQFEKLSNIVGPPITHSVFVRESINPSTRLAVTLRYLVTGESQRSLPLTYRLGDSTVHNILKEPLPVIYNKLKRIVMPEADVPMLKIIAEGFWRRWDFPHCCGSFDGKHIRIQEPCGFGSECYNYMGCHSVILLAACDHDYKYILADVGSEGRQSDGGVFQTSKIGRKLLSNNFPMPPSKAICG